jgi:hypothetical protein
MVRKGADANRHLASARARPGGVGAQDLAIRQGLLENVVAGSPIHLPFIVPEKLTEFGPRSAFSPSGGGRTLRLRSLDPEHPTLLILSRERKPKEGGRVCASARGHEPGRLAQTLGRCASIDIRVIKKSLSS